ncbi:MAG: hypothetical protein K0R19_15 [Bacillota bacterium]|jgi:diguanylate cyclase (GGDEF)-like protein|nr:hypothetical protein [Bacillota bacterium]
MNIFDRTNKWIGGFLIIGIIITLCIFLYDFYSYVTTNTRAEEKANQMLATRTSATMIREKIKSDINTVFALSSILATYESIDSKEAREFIKRVGYESPFSLLLVNDLKGNYYINNEGSVNINHPDYLVGSSGGKKYISVIYKNALYNRDMIALTAPIYHNNNIDGTVSGLYYSNYIMNILRGSDNKSDLEYQIIERNGDFILSFGNSVFRDYKNVYSFLNDVSFRKGESKNDFIQAFLNREPGIIFYTLNGKSEYFCFTPIGINDWYLITTAPNDGINLQTISIQNPTVLLAIRILILFAVLFLYILWRQARYRATIEKSKNELEILNERLKIKNEILKFKAENDLLTELYNKITSEYLISDFLKNEGRNQRHALFVIDIDDFKRINDDMGHYYGDKALVEVANEINRSFRATDIKGRIGGDEFLILLKDIKSEEDLTSKACEISKLLNNIELTSHASWKIRASIGISIFPDHGERYTELFLKADKAMYYSKEKGKGIYVIFSDDLDIESTTTGGL